MSACNVSVSCNISSFSSNSIWLNHLSFFWLVYIMKFCFLSVNSWCLDIVLFYYHYVIYLYSHMYIHLFLLISTLFFSFFPSFWSITMKFSILNVFKFLCNFDVIDFSFGRFLAVFHKFWFVIFNFSFIWRTVTLLHVFHLRLVQYMIWTQFK